jgi:hypothetical protein
MPVQNDNQALWPQDEAYSEVHPFVDHGSDFVLIEEGKPPSRIELARERMLISRLYLGLLQTITDDYGTEFAAQSDSLTYRTIGVYVFLRTVMCSPVRASQIAHALKLPRDGAEAAARVGEGSLCGTRRQRLSRYGQGKHPRFAK